MKTMTRLYKLSVFVSVLVMALAASASMASAQEGVQAIPNRLTLVYREPGTTGEVIAVLMPSMKPLNIVGRDESGAYLAVALEHGHGLGISRRAGAQRGYRRAASHRGPGAVGTCRQSAA